MQNLRKKITVTSVERSNSLNHKQNKPWHWISKTKYFCQQFVRMDKEEHSSKRINAQRNKKRAIKPNIVKIGLALPLYTMKKKKIAKTLSENHCGSEMWKKRLWPKMAISKENNMQYLEIPEISKLKIRLNIFFVKLRKGWFCNMSGFIITMSNQIHFNFY